MKWRVGVVGIGGKEGQIVQRQWPSKLRKIWLRGLIDRQKVRLWWLIGRWRLWQLRGWQ